MKPGPKPAPTAIKKISGVRESRINSKEPKFKKAPRIGTPPEWLDDPLAKEKWNEVYPQLYKAGILRVTDLDVLGAYCDTYARWRGVRELLKQTPNLLIKTPNGSLQQAPYVSIERNLKLAMTRLASELGLTPSSRGRLAGDTNEESDDIIKFMAEGSELRHAPHRETD